MKAMIHKYVQNSIKYDNWPIKEKHKKPVIYCIFDVFSFKSISVADGFGFETDKNRKYSRNTSLIID